jgi:hypothetical protein
MPFASQHSTVFETLVHATSSEGRRGTVAKLHRPLIKLNCEFAANQASELHELDPSPTSSNETKRIVQCAVELYLNLLEFYQQSIPVPSETLQDNKEERNQLLVGLSAPDILELSNLLEPLLLEYQDRHQISQDWGRLGFLTTHLNFSNVALLNNLIIPERVFVNPYFKFLEEQVALPWQRVCSAASTHQLGLFAFQLVERMMPMANDISYRVWLCCIITPYFAQKPYYAGFSQ